MLAMQARHPMKVSSQESASHLFKKVESA